MKAGTISIYDPKMGTFGSVETDMALMHFNLVDVAKFAGHLCAGSTSGFMVTKLALRDLYKNGEIPERGDIRVTTSSKNEPAEIAAFIIGASEVEHYSFTGWVIDKSIAKKKGHLVFIFERLSTGRKIKISWDKVSSLKYIGDLKNFGKAKLRIVHGIADRAEAKEWGEKVNSLVMKIIEGRIKYKLEVLAPGTDKPDKSYKKGCRCHYVVEGKL